MPENESPTPTVETGEPAALPGLDWRTIDAPGPLGDGTDSRAFGGAGMLLVWDFAAPDQLYSTNDGSTWQQLELTAAGLPAGASAARQRLDPIVIDDRGNSMTLVYITSTQGSHPQGFNEQT